MIVYLYLHGFASSPKSSKAQYLCDRFAELDLHLNVLDLNQNDFTNLTFTRQIEQTVAALPDGDEAILIGSSFGALTCAWVAQSQRQVQKLVLLAPAFGFPQSWHDRLSTTQIALWKESGYLSVYHYGEQRQIPLHYNFLQDAERYPLTGLVRSPDTLIIHGVNDEVVPVEVSREYQRQHDCVKLVELQSDHGLNDAHNRIWQEIRLFLSFA